MTNLLGTSCWGARYKLLEIVRRYNLVEGSESLIVCLADGGGSYSSLLMHLCPSSHLIFNTLVHLDKLKPEQMGVTTPTSTFCKHICPSRLTDLTVTSAHGGDLTDGQTWQEIIGTMKVKGIRINILTFDMECIGDKYIAVLDFLKMFIRTTTPSVIVIKLFCTIEESYLKSFSSTISTMYNWVHFEKPSISNYLSNEVFLIAKKRSTLPVPAESLPIQLMISSVNSNSSHGDAHMVSHILIKQLSWRKNLIMCCSIEGPSEEVGKDQSSRVTRALRYIHRQLTSLVQVWKSDTYEMDISTQHMLIGETYGKELVWRDIGNIMISYGELAKLESLGLVQYISDPCSQRNHDLERILLDSLKSMYPGDNNRKDYERRLDLLGTGLIISEGINWDWLRELWSINYQTLSSHGSVFRARGACVLGDLHQYSAWTQPTPLGAVTDNQIRNLTKNFTGVSGLLERFRRESSVNEIRLADSNPGFLRKFEVIGYPGQSSSTNSLLIYLNLSSLLDSDEAGAHDNKFFISDGATPQTKSGYVSRRITSYHFTWSGTSCLYSLLMLKRIKKGRSN